MTEIPESIPQKLNVINFGQLSMHYTISYGNPLTHFVDIELNCSSLQKHVLNFHIPAWRPGRYELANYAENISSFEAFDENGDQLKYKKTSRNCWQVKTRGTNTVKVKYQYYANQLNAGVSLLDDQQLYLNFINCLMYLEHQLMEPCLVNLKINPAYKIACGLPKRGTRQLIARDYYHLVDSPMIASAKLKHWKFRQQGVSFNLWFMGSHRLHKPKVIKAFKAFISEQIATIGDFPEPGYHFLFQLPALKIYHGVEHGNSAVIAIGPGNEINKQRYDDFLGVSSHELFHSWNIAKIRPRELLPYDFSKECYFDTGFAVEGITTYYGDLFLVRSGVINQKQYFGEINKLLKRHLENDGRHNAGLVESSRDLWVDGYRSGTPRRKVSIYTKGALVALMLDLKIRFSSKNLASLDHVMKILWIEYGKKSKGYSLSDFQQLCEATARLPLQDYFSKFIYGTTAIEDELSSLLEMVGCQLKCYPSKQMSKRLYGFRITQNEDNWVVSDVHKDSPAYQRLSIGDQIVLVNGQKPKKILNSIMGKSSLRLTIQRTGKTSKVTLHPGAHKNYYLQLRISQQDNPSGFQKSLFQNWIGSQKR